MGRLKLSSLFVSNIHIHCGPAHKPYHNLTFAFVEQRCSRSPRGAGWASLGLFPQRCAAPGADAARLPGLTLPAGASAAAARPKRPERQSPCVSAPAGRVRDPQSSGPARLRAALPGRARPHGVLAPRRRREGEGAGAPRACRSRSRGRRWRGGERRGGAAAAWRRRWAAWASCTAESGWQPRPPRPPPSAGPAAGRPCEEAPPSLSPRPGGATVPRRRKRRSCGSGTWMTSTKVPREGGGGAALPRGAGSARTGLTEPCASLWGGRHGGAGRGGPGGAPSGEGRAEAAAPPPARQLGPWPRRRVLGAPAWQLRNRVGSGSLALSFSEYRAECTRFTFWSWHLSAALRGENEIRQQTYTIMLLPTHLVCRARQGHRSCIDFFSSGKCGFNTLAYLMLLSW